MALSRVVSEIFIAEKCRNLEIRVKITQVHRKWCHSTRHPWIPTNVPLSVSFLMNKHSYIVIIGLSRTVSEINGDLSRKLQLFPPRCIFAPPLTGFPLELGIGAGVRKNRNDGATRWSKKFQDRFSRLDTTPACDIQTSSHSATSRQQ